MVNARVSKGVGPGSVRRRQLTAGAKLRRCVMRQDDVYGYCSFGASELLQFDPLPSSTPQVAASAA